MVRGVGLALAFVTVVSTVIASWGQSRTPPAATTSQAAPTLSALRARLTRIPPAQRTREDHALLAGLHFLFGLMQVDAAAAVGVVDAIGYQELPLEGELPEKPEKPVQRPALERIIAGLPAVAIGALPAGCIKLVTRRGLRETMPAIADWMLPADFALLVQPDRAEDGKPWLAGAACVVIRVRGEHATIIGGNLLAARTAEVERAATPPEDK